MSNEQRKLLSSKEFIDILKGSELTQSFIEVDAKGTRKIQISNILITENVGNIIGNHFVVTEIVHLIDCEFQSGVSLSNITFKKDVKIKNCLFLEELMIISCFFDRISVLSSTNKSHFTFIGLNCKTIILKDLICEAVKFFTVNCTHSMVVSGKGLKNFHLHGKTSFLESILLTSDLKDTAFILVEATINRLSLGGHYGVDIRSEFGNLDIHRLIIANLINRGDILFKFITVNQKRKKLSIITAGEFFKNNNVEEKERSEILREGQNDLTPLGEVFIDPLSDLREKRDNEMLLWDDASGNSICEINKSEIGNLQFKNSSWGNFNTINIIDTELTSLKTFNSPIPVKNISGDPKVLYEIFNDLFQVARNKNNRVEELLYYKTSRRKLLKSQLQAGRLKNFPSIVSLFISRVFSDFGTNWLQALALTIFGIPLLCFFGMLLSSNFDIELSKNGVDWAKESAVYYLQFLNPVHKFDFLDYKLTDYYYSNSFWFVFWDSVGRIFIGIGIYETIRSFRKYKGN